MRKGELSFTKTANDFEFKTKISLKITEYEFITEIIEYFIDGTYLEHIKLDDLCNSYSNSYLLNGKSIIPSDLYQCVSTVFRSEFTQIRNNWIDKQKKKSIKELVNEIVYYFSAELYNVRDWIYSHYLHKHSNKQYRNGSELLEHIDPELDKSLKDLEDNLSIKLEYILKQIKSQDLWKYKYYLLKCSYLYEKLYAALHIQNSSIRKNIELMIFTHVRDGSFINQFKKFRTCFKLDLDNWFEFCLDLEIEKNKIFEMILGLTYWGDYLFTKVIIEYFNNKNKSIDAEKDNNEKYEYNENDLSTQDRIKTKYQLKIQKYEDDNGNTITEPSFKMVSIGGIIYDFKKFEEPVFKMLYETATQNRDPWVHKDDLMNTIPEDSKADCISGLFKGNPFYVDCIDRHPTKNPKRYCLKE
jgi:hypothetical protein